MIYSPVSRAVLWWYSITCCPGFPDLGLTLTLQLYSLVESHIAFLLLGNLLSDQFVRIARLIVLNVMCLTINRLIAICHRNQDVHV